MSDKKYSFRGYDRESMSCAIGRDLPISTKQAIEISSMIRGVNVAKAKGALEEVAAKKRAVPFKRFTDGVGHRRGKMTGGRYPSKASKAILEILKSAETNSQQKGINTSRLEILHIASQKASRPLKFGRHRGRQAKRTHVEIVVGEAEDSKKEEKSPQKQEQKEQEKKIKKKEANKENKVSAESKREKNDKNKNKEKEETSKNAGQSAGQKPTDDKDAKEKEAESGGGEKK